MQKFKLIVLATSIIAASASVTAVECGEPPLGTPTVPNGASASADEIRDARTDVIAYSEKVDAFLACMDEKGPKLFPYMTKEQKFRWDEDLADLHNKRRDAQTAMNEAIRAYRRVN